VEYATIELTVYNSVDSYRNRLPAAS